MINYQIECKNLGFDSCDFLLTGNSESELKRKFFYHTMLKHNREFEKLMETQKIEIDNIIKNLLEDQN